jgi:tripartite-type tricarboxylate transporter receptor subunit TctC
MLSRRAVLAAAAFACGPWCDDLGAQPSFPAGTVRVIVPFPPGGATDVLGRVVAHHLQALWRQNVVVEYRTGASGLLGARQVFSSPGDGHTLLLASTGAILALASSQGLDAKYRISRDLAPVSLVASPPYILVVHPSVPAQDLAALLRYAKANPGKLSYGSSGVGAASHLSAALFEQMAGVELLHVPYRGTGLAVNDLLGGRVSMMFSPPQVVTPHIAAGKLRAIGTTAATRSALFPDYPTIAESGLRDYQSLGWFGLFVAASTPRDLVSRISADVGKVLALPEAKQRLWDVGAEAATTTPEAFAEFVDRDLKQWIELAQRTGIKLSP